MLNHLGASFTEAGGELKQKKQQKFGRREAGKQEGRMRLSIDCGQFAQGMQEAGMSCEGCGPHSGQGEAPR